MEVPDTLGEWQRDLNESNPNMGRILSIETARARRAKGGRQVDNIKIGSVEEMGEAAGTCNMCTGEKMIRMDVVATEEGIRENLAHVLAHEETHAEGISHDGIAELAVEIQLGAPPVPAYREKHAHARHLAKVMGADALIEAAKEESPDVVILQRYIQARVKKGLTPDKIESAVKEGQAHIRAAA